jgi:hypothetical protein
MKPPAGAFPRVALHPGSDVGVLPLLGKDWRKYRDQGQEALGERYPDVHMHRRLACDLPARWLLEESKNAQLVVLGSRRRGVFPGMRLGSVTSRVACSARVPVIVVPHCQYQLGCGCGVVGRKIVNCVGPLRWTVCVAVARRATPSLARRYGICSLPANDHQPPAEGAPPGLRGNSSHDRVQQHRVHRMPVHTFACSIRILPGRRPNQDSPPAYTQDASQHDECAYVAFHRVCLAAIRPVLTRTPATITPKTNPPTWAKNATPLPPACLCASV